MSPHTVGHLPAAWTRDSLTGAERGGGWYHTVGQARVHGHVEVLKDDLLHHPRRGSVCRAHVYRYGGDNRGVVILRKRVERSAARYLQQQCSTSSGVWLLSVGQCRVPCRERACALSAKPESSRDLSVCALDSRERNYFFTSTQSHLFHLCTMTMFYVSS